MKAPAKIIFSIVLLLFLSLLLSSFQKGGKGSATKASFPYKQAGLTTPEAAAHLLSRFTYGAKPGEVDAVVKMGLEKWFDQQLQGAIADKELDKMLIQFEDISLTNAEVETKYPRNAQVLRMAVREGFIHKDSVNKGEQKEYRKKLQEYMQTRGFKPPQELYRQFISQKILRAAYTNNQMQELLTDFWFNHFNVSLIKNQCAAFVPAYERDVIRPNVTGKFGDLLLATGKSPAMLTYLDNSSSSGQPVEDETEMQAVMQGSLRKKGNWKKITANDSVIIDQLSEYKARKKNGGLNENYAREVMELHTLGVEGGYSQKDVTQAAKVLTGWTVRNGNFFFAQARHDNGEKTVLNQQFSAKGGYEEGARLLNLLAHHNSTAKFISRKLAIRFVNDNPSKVLTDKMAKTFSTTDGDIKQVLITMVSSPEFWTKAALREKTKSPFELAISAARGLEAQITQPYQLFIWINKMGQRMYYYQAPTGFPDRGQYWINTGSLLNRMNFGLAFAAQRIPGIKIDLKALNNNHEPESAEAALQTYSEIIMPERKLEETLERLKPMLNDPELVSKVAKAAEKTPASQPVSTIMDEEATPLMIKENKNNRNGASAQTAKEKNTMLAQVVGIIIGSPEFQRK
ncbi:MAG TPA: DUF1800 domain-containing protein [Pedobacter sp.]|nr:DUF1800 domain-containing protein [Pedobacter sp.]